MELLGSNINGVVYQPCAGAGGSSSGTNTYPWPPKDKTMTSLPWRPSNYRPPIKNFPCSSFQPPSQQNQQQNQQQGQQTHPNQDHYFQNQSCPPTKCGQGASPFLPYRRVIEGGKVTLMPEKDGSSFIRVPKPEKVCAADHAHQQPNANIDPTSSMPITGRDTDLPMTSTKSARLNSCLQEMHEKSMDTKPFRPPCFPAALDPWRQNQAYQDIEKRNQDRQEKTIPEKTAMSSFPKDDKILKHAIRNYKRDAELQKERNQFTDPKIAWDEGDKQWHKQMLCSEPGQLDIRTESALMRSDCVRFPDGLGGHCYICPTEKEPKSREKVACNTWFTDPICHSFDSQEWTQSPKGVCATEKEIENEINDTILSVESLARQRDALHRRLMDTEQPLLELKEKVYSLPPEERCKATDSIKEINSIEKCQKKIFDDIRGKGRELTDMLIHQQALENQLTNFIIANDTNKMCDKETFEKYKY